MASRGKFWPEKESMVELRGPGRAILSKYVDRLGTIRLSLLILSATMVFAQPQPAKQLPVLTHSDQVRQLTAEQAGSASLARMRSFNGRVQSASAVVQAELRLMAKALDVRPTVSEEP